MLNINYVLDEMAPISIHIYFENYLTLILLYAGVYINVAIGMCFFPRGWKKVLFSSKKMPWESLKLTSLYDDYR